MTTPGSESLQRPVGLQDMQAKYPRQSTYPCHRNRTEHYVRASEGMKAGECCRLAASELLSNEMKFLAAISSVAISGAANCGAVR